MAATLPKTVPATDPDSKAVLKTSIGTSRAKTDTGRLRVVKKCPECLSNLPMDTKVCPWCNQRLKTSVDKHGYAKKPINWYAYLMCLLSWLGVAGYIWWVFIK